MNKGWRLIITGLVLFIIGMILNDNAQLWAATVLIIVGAAIIF